MIPATLRLPPALLRRVRSLALRKNTSASAIVTAALAQYLDKGKAA